MTDTPESNDPESQEDWQLYLQVFLDESDEDLESLVQTLLRLEQDPTDGESLNEAFRLLHTHKGSAGLMGFEGISELAHMLENRFDEYRNGTASLDAGEVTLLLRCVDFLRAFNGALRSGDPPNQDGSDLISQLEACRSEDDRDEAPVSAPAGLALPSLSGGYQVRVEFQDGLQLADMKARLIVARLANIGEIVATDPAVDDMQSVDELSVFALVVLTDTSPEEVRKIANVDGVKSVKVHGGAERAEVDPPAPAVGNWLDQAAAESTNVSPDVPSDASRPTEPVRDQASQVDVGHQEKEVRSDDVAESEESSRPVASSEPIATTEIASQSKRDSEGVAVRAEGGDQGEDTPKRADAAVEKANVSATVRVGIDRLDNLMNLTGELVVTRARIVQITDEMVTSQRSVNRISSSDDLRERLRLGIERAKASVSSSDASSAALRQLLGEMQSDFEAVDEQFDAWDRCRSQLAKFEETVDQLDKVSSDLQRSVLDTRMVPVAPLFNRFRRVIRDLADERGKRVRLVIRGEKTELDKRMIDELGDPLLHLVRNSLDHGIELPDVRERRGKPDTGSIVLEASHRGNNVFITIQDDGAGLDRDRILCRAVERGLVASSAVGDLSDGQVFDFIWAPGFSTAAEITDISGRGVGMDVVKNRITELNGSIEIESQPAAGTTIRLRLPLTLAIIRSLMARFQGRTFSIPIDDVREIVAVPRSQVHSIQGGETIEVRGEFIPLIRMDRVFRWNQSAASPRITPQSETPELPIEVVVLRSGGRTLGLVVDELTGSTDVVIKSLSDNFVNLRGLSGASIMGDGSICLMLDTSEVIRMALEFVNGVTSS